MIGSPNSPSGEAARRSIDSTATRPNYLNLNSNSGLGRLSQSSPSPASSRLVSRMTTLHEENSASTAHGASSHARLEATPEMAEDQVQMIGLSFVGSLISFNKMHLGRRWRRRGGRGRIRRD